MGHIGSIIFHRHWRDLMERTGTSFDMNPESFTLENMFSIELHKYGGVIGDIVTSAVKELSIEKVRFLLPDNAFFSLRKTMPFYSREDVDGCVGRYDVVVSRE